MGFRVGVQGVRMGFRVEGQGVRMGFTVGVQGGMGFRVRVQRRLRFLGGGLQSWAKFQVWLLSAAVSNSQWQLGYMVVMRGGVGSRVGQYSKGGCKIAREGAS